LGLQNERSEQVQVLLSRDSDRPAEIPCAPRPTALRAVWNSDVIRALVNRFGDGSRVIFASPVNSARPLK